MQVEQVQPDVHRIIDVNNNAISNSGNYITHKFQSGETLWALSRKYKVSVDAIQKANPSLKATSIRVGTKIKIPQ